MLRDDVLRFINSGYLCLESALYEYKLSSYFDYVVKVYSDKVPPIETSFYKVFQNKNGSEGIVPLRDGLFITTIERTICDLVSYDRREDFIIEALSDYHDRFGSYDELFEVALKYNVLDEIKSLIDEIEDYYNY